MTLDTPTLFTCLMIAEFAGGVILFLFYLFWTARSKACAQSLAFWSCGMFLAAIGTVLIAMRGTIPDGLSIVAANALVLFGTGLRRSGFAVFLGERSRIWFFVLCAGVWLALCQYPPFRESFLARVNYVQACLILSGLWVVWLAFFRNSEKLYSARLLGITTLMESAGFAWFTVHQNLLLFPDFLSVFPQNFMTVYLVTVLFSIIMTIVLPACMVIERSQLGFKEQAFQDPLTGLPNRRAFLNEVDGWLAGNKEEETSFSLIIFDIDRFKVVNDRFGRAMGDALLQLFGRVVRDTLGEAAIPGRVGSEEFVVFLPGEGKEFSELTAQRICRKFALACKEASAGKLEVTASAGLVTATTKVKLERAIEAADRGLCQAKSDGAGQIVAMDLSPEGSLKKSEKSSGFSLLKRHAA